MPPLSDRLQRALAHDPDGARTLPRLLACFPEAHWGAVGTPGVLRTPDDGSWARTVTLPATFARWAAGHPDELAAPLSPADEAVVLPCVVETDAFVLAIEDAVSAPLDTGTAAYPARHRLSRVIESVREIAQGRLAGVGVVAPPGFDEPRRATILEGLPHIEREEAEDLYAVYWGWCTPDAVDEALHDSD